MTHEASAGTWSSWQMAPQPVLPRPAEVHVWRFRLDLEPGALLPLRHTLSADELARAERFQFPEHRARFIAGRGVLRTLLGQYLKTPPANVRFQLGPHGKPALEAGSASTDVRFNLSHSHGLALAAFTLEREVGIDLERIQPERVDDRLIARFFSAPEVSALRALPPGARAEAFFQCWTRKEAYIKARSGGLSIGLSSFTVSVAGDYSANLLLSDNSPSETGRWSVRALQAGPPYAAAIAAEGIDYSVTQWQWEFPPVPQGS